MTRTARILLRIYPPAFRERYGAEMLDAIDAEPLSMSVVKDLLATACRLRTRQLTESLRRAAGAGTPHVPQPPKRTAMDTILQDLRFAFRQFAHRPGFAAVAVLSLGIAIGANSLIYGMLDGFVFHPFSYPDPDRLVAVGVAFPKLSSETTYVESLSPAEYVDIRESRSFARTASFDLGNRNIAGGDVPERVFTALVLDDLFPVIGMKPALGRGFTAEELGPNGPPAAIISHRLWQSRFGGDPGILKRTVRISGSAASIVGVMPAGLLVIGTDLWLPWGGDPARVPRNVRQFNVLARLAPGASLEQANAELQAIARRVELTEKARFPEYENWQLTATPWAAALLQDVRPAAFMLMAAVTLVLLIACANLTSLFLARSSTRQRELAVRLALGAAQWRLTRLMLTESMLLAMMGCAVGLLIAWIGLKSSGALIPGQFQMLGLEAGINARVLWVSIGLALLSGVLVGIAPALQATRTDPHDSLKADARSGGSRRARRVRSVLIVAELALSVVLLLGAGLLMRSFLNLQRVNRGFDSNGVLTMRLTLPRERYAGEAAGAFFENLSERLKALPGVTAVSAASQFPPSSTFSTRFALERGQAEERTLPTAVITVATPAYFDTLRVPLTAGRLLAPTDRLDTPRVVVVNQAFVARYLSGVDPLGQRLRLGSADRQGPWATIVGIVADYRNSGVSQPPKPEIYMPVRQQTEWNQLFVLIRSNAVPAGLISGVRQTVSSLDPDQPIYLVQTLDEALAASSFQERISAILTSLFAAVALGLAAIGIYGVMSYAVSMRTQEMGVRLAVGARPRDVVWLILGQVLRLCAFGLAIGIAALILAGRALEQLLFGVRAADPLTIAIVAGVLGAVALLAAWAPASRASRTDPIRALRYE
jgi:putative ABC transport system permease protein